MRLSIIRLRWCRRGGAHGSIHNGLRLRLRLMLTQRLKLSVVGRRLGLNRLRSLSLYLLRFALLLHRRVTLVRLDGWALRGCRHRRYTWLRRRGPWMCTLLIMLKWLGWVGELSLVLLVRIPGLSLMLLIWRWMEWRLSMLRER